MMKIRVVHYLNQFFGQIGGEDKANIPPQLKEGALGPGLAFNAAFGDQAEIVATVICGDSYFNENIEKATEYVAGMIASWSPDVVIAGPAFNAGRYGVACGAVAKGVRDMLGIPVVSGMYPENPGVELFQKYVYIVETGNSAATMREAAGNMAALAVKLVRGEEIKPGEHRFIGRSVRQNYFAPERGSARAIKMLLKKLKDEEYVTEYPMPHFDRVDPASPVIDITKARIALVTSGGIVPKGNPDRIESSSASKFGRYSIEGVSDLTALAYETAHGGYDPTYANADADRVLPVDVLRQCEKEGKIGKLHEYYYTTVGNGTSVANAQKFAREIVKQLIGDKVSAVILTST